MLNPTFQPPWFLKNGLAMTLYVALWTKRRWEKTVSSSEPPYQEMVFRGANDVPIYGWMAIPDRPRATIVATYGITGTLDNQWFLRILGRKAFERGYAVVLFDWRAHGKTAELSPTLTSDGLYEGEDFVRIAAQAKAKGCSAPMWFMGYSLGGQLALWAVKAAAELDKMPDVDLTSQDIGGAAVICPSLDSTRSLTYLVQQRLGRYLERSIAKELQRLAWRIHDAHPGTLDREAIARTTSIWGFDHELVISRLGFPSVEAYYDASSPLALLPHLKSSTLILYAADDPMFDPSLVADLESSAAQNPNLELWLTPYGGHVGYLNHPSHQKTLGDPDPWWAWNRILEWLEQRT